MDFGFGYKHVFYYNERTRTREQIHIQQIQFPYILRSSSDNWKQLHTFEKYVKV